eukprot:c2043_g1_i1.p1 GENE.c2043_g1_i1~~c2043_g1_i1.p1  ORF type:complete len:142 (-),score=27.87 c2043_g1_i1:86-487(-)
MNKPAAPRLQDLRPLASAGAFTQQPQHVARHPVEQIQLEYSKNQDELRFQVLSQVHGSALPLQLMTEQRILSQVSRLPVLHSSRMGLHTMRNDDERFSFEDWLCDPRDSELMIDVHKATEHMIGLKVKSELLS